MLTDNVLILQPAILAQNKSSSYLKNTSYIVNIVIFVGQISIHITLW